MAFVLLGAAALSAQTTDTSNAEANRLFVEAVMLYRSAEGQDPDEAAATYSQVRDRIDRIVAEYPATDQADLLRGGGVVAGMDLARLPAPAPAGGGPIAGTAPDITAAGDTTTVPAPLTEEGLAVLARAYRDSFAAVCAEPHSAESGLPCPFVDPASCEGEGCVIRGPLRARQDVDLVAFPGADRVVATVPAGAFAFAEYGEVWLAPCKSRVQSNTAPAMPDAGRIFWRLRYEGEGVSVYWAPGVGYQSREDETFDTISTPPGGWAADPCNRDTRHAWLLVTTEAGQRGWTRAARDFDGSDRFGGADLSDAPQWVRDADAGPVLSGPAIHATVLALASAQPHLTSGWTILEEPDDILRQGEVSGPIALGADHGVGVDGATVLAGMPLANPSELHLFRSPDGGSVLAMHRDQGYWGVRAVLVSPQDPRVAGADLIAPGEMRGMPDARDVKELAPPVAWSSGGRYALLRYSPADYEHWLAIIDRQTGRHATLAPPDLPAGTWGAVKMETLRALGDGRHSVVFELASCRDAGCTDWGPAGETTVTFVLDEAATAWEQAAGSPTDPAAPEATVSGPIGATVDLFNVFNHLLFGRCDDGCVVDGVVGRYAIAPMTAAAAEALVGVRGCEMLFAQAVPQCFPADLPLSTTTPEFALYDVRRAACRDPGCDAMLIAINRAAREIARADPAYSGMGGYVLDFEVPASEGTPSAQAVEAPGEIIEMTEATGAQLAALLRINGVADTNTRVQDDPAGEAAVAALAEAFRTAQPVLRTPALPASVEAYDAAGNVLSLCVRHRILLPADVVAAEDPGDFPAVILEPEAPIQNAYGFRPLCVVGNGGAIADHEARFGRGEMERFGLLQGSHMFVNVRAGPSVAALLARATELGALRVTADCDMVYRERQPGQSTRYPYLRFGTCVPNRLILGFEDRAEGLRHTIAFRARGELYPAEGELVSEPIPTASPAAATAGTVARAARSFETETGGEAAIRTILEGFVGQPAETVIGYANAFPFQSDPRKELAVALFGRLPQDEIDTVAGTERGYGSFVIKTWSDLNRFYFADDPRPGLATVHLGEIEELRILSLRNVSGGDCEWSTSYRIWLRNPSPFGTALAEISGKDGYTFSACFRTTRSGFDIVEQAYLD